MHVRIEKIGGENSAALKETIRLIQKNQHHHMAGIYVFSAFRTSEYNTTSELLRVVEYCRSGNKALAKSTLDAIRSFYRATLDEEWFMDIDREKLIESLFLSYQERIEAYFLWYQVSPEESNDYTLDGVSFLGAGEIITTRIYQSILFHDSATGSIDPAIQADYRTIPALLEKYSTVISPGYYAGLPGGIIGSWWRGYSDATALRIYENLKKILPEWNLTLAIRKMYPICSADPRRIDAHRVKKLDHISLKLLLEMIGTHGASGQFINQNAASPQFFENGGKLQIYTEDDPLGSIVSLSGNPSEKGILFVQSKAIHVFMITSYQFNTPWYTEHIWHFFTREGINIDNIVTSQTEMTITVADKDLQWREIHPLKEALLQSLREFESSSRISPEIRIEEYVNLYIGGENIDFPGILSRITAVLQKAVINIALMMQPLHPQVIIIGVRKSDESRAIDCLHREFIEQTPIH